MKDNEALAMTNELLRKLSADFNAVHGHIKNSDPASLKEYYATANLLLDNMDRVTSLIEIIVKRTIASNETQ
jgi:hypothetical protein